MKKFKILSVFLVLAILICIAGNYINQNTYIDDDISDIAVVNTYLLNAGFSQELLDTMLDAQKEIIYQHSDNKQIKFAGYETTEFSLDKKQNLSSIRPSDNLKSDCDFKIFVFATHTMDANGTLLYSSIYPSFVWNTPVKVKNDTFSMAVSPDFEAIPGEENFRLRLMNNDGKTAKRIDLNPASSGSSGYSYKIPSGIGTKQGVYIGCAYYDIDALFETAAAKITLQYVHDRSLFSNVSYGVHIELGDIILSSDNDKLCVISTDYDFFELT